MTWLYNILLFLLAPLWMPWMWWRANKRAEKVDWSQRAGRYKHVGKKDKGAKRIWFHAVSVGEVVAASPILREIIAKNPDVEIVLSVTTSSGHQTAREKFEDAFDHLIYFPIDVPRYVLNALVKIKPDVVVLMETELWLNFLEMSKNFGANTLVVNGRISDRAFGRMEKFKPFYQAIFRNVDRALMQSETDADRARQLGSDKAEVMGNCKFDEAASVMGVSGAEWREKLGIEADEFVIVVGSTRGEMEEKFVLDALKSSEGSWDRVVHAPRHLERVDALAGQVTERFGSVSRRSKEETGKYLLLDTYGELAQVYAVADLVVIGGGFDDLGGQNILQPLAHGKPVIHGPNMHNFRDVAELAARCGATQVASTPEELASAMTSLGKNDEKRSEMGSAARQLIEQSLGASERYADAVLDAVQSAEFGSGRK
ncbi:MAG: 3-deoxy-D-manno-octulosonic acid transferase [Armatimonadetes bacterium]|nr:3-deoxy-D-manno-octulosonic acid transferase [Armatimonadota bacterium]